jgi:nitrogen fixation/metabolism regulation signal transduction histidine kinase
MEEAESVIATKRNRNVGKSYANGVGAQESKQENLTRAFLTFTQAANSLERSYSQLQGEIARLHQELERANAELDRSLEENARVRGYLTKVLERLPCGVVAADAKGSVQILNPEAEKLLGLPKQWKSSVAERFPGVLQKLLAQKSMSANKGEQELAIENESERRLIGVMREEFTGAVQGTTETIWILRDLTEQKRLASEREAVRRSQALAEVATVLAHEIRNPLGSMELFTGLLADASAHLPETRQWITHLRAGLRALSATMTNVVDVYVNYLRRKVDSGYDRPLIRTVRGTGYQIGLNALVS